MATNSPTGDIRQNCGCLELMNLERNGEGSPEKYQVSFCGDGSILKLAVTAAQPCEWIKNHIVPSGEFFTVMFSYGLRPLSRLHVLGCNPLEEVRRRRKVNPTVLLSRKTSGR